MTGPVPAGVALGFDTDVGSDVDDLLALATVLGSPELDLRAVTTVYGDTLLRARIVHRAFRVAGREAPPVAAGAVRPWSGREVWWGGYEGDRMPDLDAEPVDAALDAVALLRAQPRVLAVGPLTNVAAALADGAGADQADGVPSTEVTMMGGAFPAAGRHAPSSRPGPEHNVSSDVDAAAAVFDAGVPVTVVGLDQTTRLSLTDAEVDRIGARGPFGRLLADEVRHYWSVTGRHGNAPHDAAAAVLLTRPDLFTLTSGRVRVDAAGVTRLEPGPGPHRVVTDLDPVAVLAAVVDRVCRVGSPDG